MEAAMLRLCTTVLFISVVTRVTGAGVAGLFDQLQERSELSGNAWTDVGAPRVALEPTTCERLRVIDPRRDYRLVGPEVVWIGAGTFTMGSPDSEPARYSSEGPQTRVTISRGFWMGKYEVTQGEYQAVMGSNPSIFQGGNLPVETVSRNEAVGYCVALTTRERSAGRIPAGYVYRLPTEAEWEYACRAGTTTAFHYGNELRSGMANFDGHFEYPPCGSDTYYCYNSSGFYFRTTTVGSYAPNAWGLYDMHGNVWEWCQDWWSSSLPGGSLSDPQGSPTGSYRVYRGGGWGNRASDCRSASRYGYYPVYRGDLLGFRVALVPVP